MATTIPSSGAYTECQFQKGGIQNYKYNVHLYILSSGFTKKDLHVAEVGKCMCTTSYVSDWSREEPLLGRSMGWSRTK